ncbi:MAG: GDSL-type esterase/lipase family protein [Frankia sp.]
MSRLSRVVTGLAGPLVLTAGFSAASQSPANAATTSPSPSGTATTNAARSNAAAPAAATPVKIMVVGDSISQGHTGDYTWRYRFWQHLKADQVSFDLVGPKTTVWDATNAAGTNLYLDPNFDQDHDAVWGEPVIKEKDTIAAEMAQANPDVLLVDLGVNDMSWGYTDAAGTAANMATFIANARSTNPTIKIVLSELTPRGSTSSGASNAIIADYNSRLLDLANQLSTTQSPVVIANPTVGFTPDTDTYDGTHPTPSGEYKIAAAFSDALANDFGIGQPFGAIPAAPAWPLPPTTLSAAPGNGQMTLTWTPTPGADGYYVYQRDITTGGQFQQLPLSVPGPSFTGGYLTNGHTYEYALATIRGTTIGPLSTTTRVTPTAPLPAPTGLTATPGNTTATLTWNPVTGAAGYYVYYRDVTAGQTTFTRWTNPVTTTATTSIWMTNGHQYQFAISTLTTTGVEGTTTAPVTVTLPLPAPTGLTATPGNGSATLTWNPVTGAAGYYVYYRDVTAGQTTYTRWTNPVTTTATTSIWMTNGHQYQFAISTLTTTGVEGPTTTITVTPHA